MNYLKYNYIKTIISAIFLLTTIYSNADIKPNPISAKGIVTGCNTAIRMVSERVVVDLYKDSAIVECYFYMKNDSAAQKLTIGFPEMNFSYFSSINDNKIQKFTVFENDEQIKLINYHQIDTLSSKEQFVFDGLFNRQDEDQPWYLWNSTFDEGEQKTIVVRYCLPFGAMKNGCRYFNYLLNTGSGWKGTIGKAEIVINLMDISPDLILKTMPENFKINENKIIWTFTDFEPTTKDDIKIYYEPSKGYYDQTSKINEPIVVVNDKICPTIDLFELETISIEGFAKLINVKAEEIVSIEVLKDEKSALKYNSKNGVLLIYTKGYTNKKVNNN